MYKAQKNSLITQKLVNSSKSEKRPTEYAVTKDDQIIAYIPDYFTNSEEIAFAFAEILNQNRTILFEPKI